MIQKKTKCELQPTAETGGVIKEEGVREPPAFAAFLDKETKKSIPLLISLSYST